jgi:hypothetical protein
MKASILVTVASAILLTVIPAAAGLNDRLIYQRQRIAGGVYSGRLAPTEAAALIREQRRIQHLKTVYQRDGWLSRGERRELDRRLDRASGHIYRLKNGDRSRSPVRPCIRYRYHR